jgi:hypothetical protein
MQPRLTASVPASRGRRTGRGTSRGSVTRKAIPLVAVALCVLGIACQDVYTVWTEEARSPDGLWIASARTEQHGGPGTAGIDTIVYLKWTRDSNPPQEVLGFACGGPVPRPFVLDNKANAGGTIDLRMKWLTPRHLEVAYNSGEGSLYFQVVKTGGIDISVRDLSGGMAH